MSTAHRVHLKAVVSLLPSAICRSVSKAVQQFTAAIECTPLASGGVTAALMNEWNTVGPVRLAAEAVGNALMSVLRSPSAVPLHHHHLGPAATAVLLQLCFEHRTVMALPMTADESTSLKHGVGAIALRMHLQLGADGWLRRAQLSLPTAIDASWHACYISTSVQAPAEAASLRQAW